MIQSKQEYLSILKQGLRKSTKTEEIIQEFDQLVTDMLDEMKASSSVSESEAMQLVIQRMGTPEQVAELYQEELAASPVKIQWMFIIVNLLFFVSGTLLTFSYHLISIPAIEHLWVTLTTIPLLLILLYMFFWVLLGYEIGKEFGLGGKGLLSRTFYIALVPNLMLMALVILRILPVEWFQPLLTPTFITICVLCTALLYPISVLGFRWGAKQSV